MHIIYNNRTEKITHYTISGQIFNWLKNWAKNNKMKVGNSMTEYDNLKIFTNKIINEKKSKKFALTLLGDALEYALPNFTSAFYEISINVHFDDSNNFTFELLVDKVVKNVENIHINSTCVSDDIAYIMYTMFKKYGIDIELIELEEE